MTRTPSIDPASSPDEAFTLYSVPAFDAGTPDILAGRQIGSAKQVVQSDDVLLSRIVPHIRRAWVVNGASTRTIASGEWIVFRSERSISS
jgi:type I restriction enzyme S subunit